MRTVSVGELRNQLRGCLEYVQNGEEILVRDRDVPIARILPLQQGAKHEHDASMAVSGETSMPADEMDREQFFSHRTGSVSHEDAVAAAIQSRGRSVSPTFWDTSALVPLCVQQQPSTAVRELLQQHSMVVWWATPVEMRSAFERLFRMAQLTAQGHTAAGRRLDQLRRSWHEVQPSLPLRAESESCLRPTPLKAADALQLAAAWTWSLGIAETHTFISADMQLLQAARQLGFQVISA